MTDKQREVMDQIHALINEHFDAGVYCLHVSDVGDKLDTEDCAGYLGSSVMALGMMEKYKHQLLHGTNESENDNED